MALTQNELLNLFSQVASIKNSDQFLIVSASADGTVRTTKITAELVRAYLNKGFELTVGDDGYLYIGGKKSESKVAGITPQLQRGVDGIYCSTDEGKTWTPVAYFSDFSQQNMVLHTLTEATIRPNVLNVWGAVAGLAIEFTGGGENLMSEYMLEFTVSGSSFHLYLPSDVRWSEDPEWEDGYTYQVSIVNGLAIYAGWEGIS